MCLLTLSAVVRTGAGRSSGSPLHSGNWHHVSGSLVIHGQSSPQMVERRRCATVLIFNVSCFIAGVCGLPQSSPSIRPPADSTVVWEQ